MTYSDDLIGQAEELLSRDRRRPKQVSLRRAVSAAYYAFFHEVIDRAIHTVLSNPNAAGLIGDRLRRVVHHKGALTAAKWFASSPGSMPPALQAMRASPPAPQPGIDANLSRICGLFVELQAERHRADYDLSAPFSRTEAQRLVANAKAAVATLRGMQAERDVVIFLLACILGEGLTRNPKE